MMGFPSLTRDAPSSGLVLRRKRASGNSNSGGGHNGPEMEALSTGLTSDVGDVALRTPTKRKNVEEEHEDRMDGGTPRKRPRSLANGEDSTSFAEVCDFLIHSAFHSFYEEISFEYQFNFTIVTHS